MFYSMYDVDGKIIGTQWLGDHKWLGKEEKEVQNKSFYKLPNYEDADYIYKTH